MAAAAHLPRARAQSECTALMWAAISGHADCARLLLDAGAIVDATDKVRGRPAASAGLPVLFGSTMLLATADPIRALLHNVIERCVHV